MPLGSDTDGPEFEAKASVTDDAEEGEIQDDDAAEEGEIRDDDDAEEGEIRDDDVADDLEDGEVADDSAPPRPGVPPAGQGGLQPVPIGGEWSRMPASQHYALYSITAGCWPQISLVGPPPRGGGML